jgi:hypothetical protein
MKILAVVAELSMRTDGQTDRQTDRWADIKKLTVALCNFAKALKITAYYSGIGVKPVLSLTGLL